MKIRNGFVSNSSSASFILIANTPTQNSKSDGRTWTLANGKVHKDYEKIQVQDFSDDVCWTRSYIKYFDGIGSKSRYIMGIYAYACQEDKDYFEKVLTLRDKIIDLGLKHDYNILLTIPPLYASFNKKYKDGKWIKTGGVSTYVKINTEITYISDIVDMCEDSDTYRLEQFIFCPDSFGLLGGDEYRETYDKRKDLVGKLNEIRKSNPDFSYIRYADDPDRDWTYTDKDGEHIMHDSWESDCFEDYPDWMYDDEETSDEN